MKIPRCSACDELIFAAEYTGAEDQHWHLKHFCCWLCDRPLAGHKYIPVEGQPHCLMCWQATHGKVCSACNEYIGPEEQRVSLGENHWHTSPACFRCGVCSVSLLGGKMSRRGGVLLCSSACAKKLPPSQSNAAPQTPPKPPPSAAEAQRLPSSPHTHQQSLHNPQQSKNGSHSPSNSNISPNSKYASASSPHISPNSNKISPNSQQSSPKPPQYTGSQGMQGHPVPKSDYYKSKPYEAVPQQSTQHRLASQYGGDSLQSQQHVGVAHPYERTSHGRDAPQTLPYSADPNYP